MVSKVEDILESYRVSIIPLNVIYLPVMCGKDWITNDSFIGYKSDLLLLHSEQS